MRLFREFGRVADAICEERLYVVPAEPAVTTWAYSVGWKQCCVGPVADSVGMHIEEVSSLRRSQKPRQFLLNGLSSCHFPTTPDVN